VDEELQRYFDLIVDALDLVEQPYYNLATTYMSNGIVRERVFCYELYHQMRCLQEIRGEKRLSLNGEIDKRGHKDFQVEDRKNPDFVFHIPGQMEGNTFVVEVKGTISKDCIKDFQTISTFIQRCQYKFGVFILYNYSLDECRNALIPILRECLPDIEETEQSIYIVCEKSHQDAPEVKCLYDLL